MSETFTARIKPLVWETDPDTDRDTWSDGIGMYKIRRHKFADGTTGKNYYASVVIHDVMSTGLGGYKDLETTKAACQRDHDSRVMALLEILPEAKS